MPKPPAKTQAKKPQRKPPSPPQKQENKKLPPQKRPSKKALLNETEVALQRAVKTYSAAEMNTFHRKYSAGMKEATEYLKEHRLWDVPAEGIRAYKWDQYIRLLLDAFLEAPHLKDIFGSPLDALRVFLEVPGTSVTKAEIEFSRKLHARIASDILLRDTYRNSHSHTFRDEAAAELRKRGLLK